MPMKPDGYLGIDVGGTSAKAGVVDRQGRLLAIAHRPYHPHLTPEGYVEIPIETIHAAAGEAVAAAVRESSAHILAMSISSQGQTFVSLNERDEPLHSAIVWYDARASTQADRLSQALQSVNLHEPLPSVDPTATGPKIMWLREHFPAVMSHASRYLLLPDYLAYVLTGNAATDPTTASSTGLYAEDTADYCSAALDAAGVTKAQISEIRMTGQPIGHIHREKAAEWQLTPETLVVTGTNDQYAGALGAGNCRPGIVSVTTGTCLALVTLTEHLPHLMPAGLFGGRFPIPRYHYVLAFSKTAGVILEWFNRELSPGKSLRDLDQIASSVPIGSGGVIMLPHFDGMISPVPNPDARGAFLNLSLHHTRADMYHAILESLGFSLYENLQLLQESRLNTGVVRSIGGGAKSDCWLQITADITGLPIERPVVTEAAVVGAAMIAAVGSGAFATLEECSEAFYRKDREFAPRAQNHAQYEDLFNNYVRLYRYVYLYQREPEAR
jgi:xylulokinase